MIVIAVAFILTLGGVFMAMLLLGLLWQAWPIVLLIILWLILKDLMKERARSCKEAL